MSDCCQLCLGMDLGTKAAALNGNAAVTLVGRDEPDAAQPPEASLRPSQSWWVR